VVVEAGVARAREQNAAIIWQLGEIGLDYGFGGHLSLRYVDVRYATASAPRFRFTLTAPVYAGLKRTVKVFVHGASIVRIENGKISDSADYYDGLTSRRTALASFFTEWIEL
jgi:hypothetical protein